MENMREENKGACEAGGGKSVGAEGGDCQKYYIVGKAANVNYREVSQHLEVSHMATMTTTTKKCNN